MNARAHGIEVAPRRSEQAVEENPSISTTGIGTLDLRIDDEAQTMEYELSYEALEGVGTTPFVTGGGVLASHIHVGARGVNGGVSAFLCGGGGKPAPAASPPSSTGACNT